LKDVDTSVDVTIETPIQASNARLAGMAKARSAGESVRWSTTRQIAARDAKIA
jgi:hypothetical protein